MDVPRCLQLHIVTLANLLASARELDVLVVRIQLNLRGKMGYLQK